MFRKTLLAIAATAAIGAAALTPTAASAGWHGHHHWHGGYRVGIYVPTTYLATDSCYTVKRTVLTPVGPRKRYFTVCD